MKYQPAKSALSDCASVLAVTWTEPALAEAAAELANRLGLPLAESGQQPGLLLRLTQAGLELLKLDDPHLRRPLRVDFTAGALDFRRRQPGRELLLRAVGCKGTVRPAVLDATGGLGRDSFLLAAAGCQVRIVEREPVLAALLADGLKQASLCPETAEIAARIRLTVGDAIAVLQEMRVNGQRAEVIYLDPMFPERRKSALVKKEAQFLQLLAAPDNPETEKELLTAALAVSQRVAIKRPVWAPFLAGRQPSHFLTGKTVRFDVHTLSGAKGFGSNNPASALLKS
jgi:16S rRNA (guanine1516-N2)-methyltransferase